MSQHSILETAAVPPGITPETLEIIREEQITPALSSILIKQQQEQARISNDIQAENTHEKTARIKCTKCPCCEKLKEDSKIFGTLKKTEADNLKKALEAREAELKEEFEKQLQKEIAILTDRFDFILKNEQIRASYMLTEAYRERQEKVKALQTQLECKNLAGMMYVMCSERRKSKLEKLRVVEEYTNYITALHDILSESQSIILNLSLGYKTAARVDYEWRDKMESIMTEFQKFLCHYIGGYPETSQYLFDMQNLLTTKAPILDNPEEDPIQRDPIRVPSEEYTTGPPLEKPWYEKIDEECRPFIVFGDMAEFKPPERRAVLKNVKAKKTAPKHWKEYVFNEKLMQANCPLADYIKDEYDSHLQTVPVWECRHTIGGSPIEKDGANYQQLTMVPGDRDAGGPISRRATTASVDIRGMSSLIKIITSAGLNQPVTKATLLGARDSIEIASTTKLPRDKQQHSKSLDEAANATLNVGSRRTSFYAEASFYDLEDEDDKNGDKEKRKEKEEEKEVGKEKKQEVNVYSKTEKDDQECATTLLSTHTDSRHVIPLHVADQDNKINYEKLCPVEECKKLKTDSFMRSLPSYMRANPFTHFQQVYDKYEPCTPEQLEILKKRIDDKKRRLKNDPNKYNYENPANDWVPDIEGVGVQTSEISMSGLPPCTCRDPQVSPVLSEGQVYRLADLVPMKLKLDEIARDCFFDENIDFKRFKVIGEKTSSTFRPPNPAEKENFTKLRLLEIRKVLKKYPDLCEIFQANAQCGD